MFSGFNHIIGCSFKQVYGGRMHEFAVARIDDCWSTGVKSVYLALGLLQTPSTCLLS